MNFPLDHARAYPQGTDDVSLVFLELKRLSGWVCSVHPAIARGRTNRNSSENVPSLLRNKLARLPCFMPSSKRGRLLPANDLGHDSPGVTSCHTPLTRQCHCLHCQGVNMFCSGFQSKAPGRKQVKAADTTPSLGT